VLYKIKCSCFVGLSLQTLNGTLSFVLSRRGLRSVWCQIWQQKDWFGHVMWHHASNFMCMAWNGDETKSFSEGVASFLYSCSLLWYIYIYIYIYITLRSRWFLLSSRLKCIAYLCRPFFHTAFPGGFDQNWWGSWQSQFHQNVPLAWLPVENAKKERYIPTAATWFVRLYGSSN